jgi:hypothetical protein
MNNWKTKGLIAATIIVLLIPVAGIRFRMAKLQHSDISTPQFVGGMQCIACHENEYTQWEYSHHAKAMAHATDSTVLGDFNNAEYTYNGITHKFYKRNNKFFVFTKGIDGKMEEYEISHTFGYTPLQQYLIPFERGKYQCLPIAWDTRRGHGLIWVPWYIKTRKLSPTIGSTGPTRHRTGTACVPNVIPPT